MVESSVHSTKTGVELADIVRRFGPKYTTQYGHVMMPSQKRALADIAACCTEELVSVGKVFAIEKSRGIRTRLGLKI